jgi:hypothetical protein
MKPSPLFNILFLATFFVLAAVLSGADFAIEKTKGEGLRIFHKGKPFAEYVVDQGNKPYLYPVHGPTGAAMTRNYPMKTIEGERHDHPHHRGINFGHEDIGGADSWSEQLTWDELGKNPKRAKLVADRVKALGSIKHRSYEKLVAIDEHALVVELCDYLDASGKKVISEERRMTFRAGKDVRSIDFDQYLVASEGLVAFADKKDAGLSIRVPSSMDVTAKLGGTIVNSRGDRDKAAWSKMAEWCDYNGPVGEERLGVAILNHPSSFRHPTGWHVRTYGLFTANPFASKQFDKNAPDARFELKAGAGIKLHHRILFHKGDEKQAKVAEAFEAYAKESKK